MKDRITIKDIARETGVSRGTVDRVLNNRDGVAEATRQKVLAKIEELNYRPNRIAQSLVLQKQYDLKIIIPSKPADFWTQVRAGIMTAAEELVDFGLSVSMLSPGVRNAFREKELLERVLKEGADGVAISPSDAVLMTELINKVVDNNIPVLTFNSDVADSNRFCYVGLNNLKSGRVAGELMGKLLNGRGKVAVFVSYIPTSATDKRRMGFCDVIQSRFPGVEIIEVLENQDSDQLTYQLTCQLLENYPDLTGLFVTNASGAGAGHALMDKNRTGMVRLLTFDITEEITNLLKKGVIYATICQDPFNQGYQTVRYLFDYIVLGKRPEKNKILTMPTVMFAENLVNGEQLA